VILDPDDAEDVAGKTLNVNGGKLDWRAGAIPTVALNSGTVNLQNARISFTPGGTAGTYSSGCTIARNDAVVSLANITNIGSGKANVGGATPL
jgi:hypothetical protein